MPEWWRRVSLSPVLPGAVAVVAAAGLVAHGIYKMDVQTFKSATPIVQGILPSNSTAWEFQQEPSLNVMLQQSTGAPATGPFSGFDNLVPGSA